MRLLTAVSLVRVQQGEPKIKARFSSGFFFYLQCLVKARTALKGGQNLQIVASACLCATTPHNKHSLSPQNSWITILIGFLRFVAKDSDLHRMLPLSTDGNLTASFYSKGAVSRALNMPLKGFFLFFLVILMLCCIDDLLCFVGRNILIANEFAGKGTARLRHGTQIRGIL